MHSSHLALVASSISVEADALGVGWGAVWRGLDPWGGGSKDEGLRAGQLTCWGVDDE